MKVFKIKVGDRKFIVKAEDSITAVRKLQDIQLADDRLSPMTYKKLKELGYTNNQWKDWTQEQANKVVASHEEKANQETRKKEEKGSESNTNKEVRTNSNTKENTNSSSKSFDNMTKEDLASYFSGKRGEELSDKLNKKLAKIEKDLANNGDENAEETSGYELQDRILEEAGQSKDDYLEDELYSASLLLMFDDPSYLEDASEKELEFFKAGLRYLGIEHQSFSEEEQMKIKAERKEAREKKSLYKTNNVKLLEKYADDEDHRVRWDIAENPNTPVEILEKLSKDRVYDVRAGVAHNPNAPQDILLNLSKDNNYLVRDYIAENPNSPVEALEGILSRDPGVDTVKRIAENPNASVELLERLTKSNEPSVVRGVAQNPNAPVKLLERLSKDKNKYAREGVAFNKNAPASILSSLSNDEDDWVKYGVALNANTPSEILRKLAKEPKRDQYTSIKAGVAENINTPMDVLLDLAQSDERGFTGSVAFLAKETIKQKKQQEENK